jgi:hypothetical protein
MDAAQQFLRQQEVQVPEKFVVAGASKVSQYIRELFIKINIICFFLAWMDK